MELSSRAANKGPLDFTITVTEKAPTWAFTLLKVATKVLFSFKNPLC